VRWESRGAADGEVDGRRGGAWVGSAHGPVALRAQTSRVGRRVAATTARGLGPGKLKLARGVKVSFPRGRNALPRCPYQAAACRWLLLQRARARVRVPGDYLAVASGVAYGVCGVGPHKFWVHMPVRVP
jgi:hypothetical protein